jgi:hypothetical protein
VYELLHQECLDKIAFTVLSKRKFEAVESAEQGPTADVTTKPVSHTDSTLSSQGVESTNGHHNNSNNNSGHRNNRSTNGSQHGGYHFTLSAACDQTRNYLHNFGIDDIMVYNTNSSASHHTTSTSTTNNNIL